MSDRSVDLRTPAKRFAQYGASAASTHPYVFSPIVLLPPRVYSSAMSRRRCRLCDGSLFVCQWHLRPAESCCGGISMPCPRCVRVRRSDDSNGPYSAVQPSRTQSLATRPPVAAIRRAAYPSDVVVDATDEFPARRPLGLLWCPPSRVRRRIPRCVIHQPISPADISEQRCEIDSGEMQHVAHALGRSSL